MKRSELFFDAIRLPVDFFALLAAGLLAYAIRVSPLVRQIRPILFAVDLPLGEYLGLVVAVSAVTLAIFALLGLYAMAATRRFIDEFTRIVSGVTLAIFAVIFFMFIRAELFNSRFILLAAWMLAIILVTAARLIVRALQIRLLARGIGAHRVVLVGDSLVADQFRSLFAHRPGLGYRLVGKLARPDRASLARLARDPGIDQVIRCDPDLPETDMVELLDFCEDHKVDIAYVPDLYETRVGNVVMRTLAGFPLVELRRTPLEGWGRIGKRVLDLAGSLVGLILLAPFLIATAAAILLNSRGPIFFLQTRVGKHQRPFRIVKFRTMIEHADVLKPALLSLSDRQGPLFKMRDDPRVTRIGRILRRYRFDELPQLFNVLHGQMSLVGPRPHLPEEIARYEREHRKLFTVKPGMTGLSQVSGSSSLPFEKEAALDIHYIEHWSPKLDLIILFRTLGRLLGDRSAV